MPIINCQKVYHNTQSKEGKKYRTKAGASFTIINIKSADGKFYTFSDFGGIGAGWTDGCTIDTDALGLQIEEKDWNGQKSYQLSKVRKADPKTADLLQRVTKLEEKVQKMADWIKANLAKS